MREVVLTIGGLDPTGRAGLAADIRAIEAAGGHAAPVAAVLTAQNARGVRQVEPAGPLMLLAQARAVAEDLPVAAVKTGLLGTAGNIDAVRTLMEELKTQGHTPPLVIDPVLAASTGGKLTRGAPATLRKSWRRLCAHAALITPNLMEAAQLLGELPAGSERLMRAQAEGLAERYGCAVLLKGGHLDTDRVLDVLVTEDGRQDFISPRQPDGERQRGTGCTLAALIALNLARSRGVAEAVLAARRRLHAGMAHPQEIGGAGAAPLRIGEEDMDEERQRSDTERSERS